MTDTLQKYFNFTEADLLANRNGRLSPAQHKRLVADEKSWDKLRLAGGILLLIVAALPPLFIGLAARSNPGEFLSQTPLPLLIFLALMIVVWMPVWAVFGVRAISDGLSTNRDFPMRKAEGPVNFVKEKYYDSTAHLYKEDYELHVGGIAFDCDSDLADMLMRKDVYAVYYVEKSKEILSVEKLKSG
jgi:hypothetical protein